MQTKTYSLHIPKPCHQGWQEMQPSDGGRYCNHCSKTVVDFTQMSDEAIQQYFIQRQGESVCGHFKTVQLQRVRITLPGYVLQKKLSSWQKFLVMLLLCFGSNFMGIDVLWGGNGNALYAQTVTKSKGVAKAKKSKAKRKRVKRINDQHDTESFRASLVTTWLGYIQAKPEPPHILPEWGWRRQAVEDTANNTALAKNDSNKKSPPPSTPPQRSEYLLPLAWRRRKKRHLGEGLNS